MNPAIENFVTFTTNTVQKMLDTMPVYGDVPNGYDTALKLVSQPERKVRAHKALRGIEEELVNLCSYLKLDTVTPDEKMFLLTNLANFLIKLPESQFTSEKFSVTRYGFYESVEEIKYLKFPQGETRENVELNALSDAVLMQLEQFNVKQELLLEPIKTSQARGKLTALSAREEHTAPVLLEPTLFDLLIGIMLSSDVELAQNYHGGLSQLKTLPSFVSAMARNVEQFVKAAGEPQSVRGTVAYMLSATPRTRFCFFGTHAQNLLDSLIAKEIKSRSGKTLPVATAVADRQDNQAQVHAKLLN
jgi:hypothetical protein